MNEKPNNLADIAVPGTTYLYQVSPQMSGIWYVTERHNSEDWQQRIPGDCSAKSLMPRAQFLFDTAEN